MDQADLDLNYATAGCTGVRGAVRLVGTDRISPPCAPPAQHIPDCPACDTKAAHKAPLATGCFDYFPDALREVALVSVTGNAQHNAGAALRWDRTKAPDEANALARHFLKRGTRDTDGARHSAKVAWRALALLQREIEGEHNA